MDRLDHRALIAALTPEVKGQLTQRADAPGLRHLALYTGALALTTIGIAAQIPLWPLLILPQGILLVFLFTLSHECTHKTPFKTPWLNEVTGHAVGLLILLPFTWFRYFHLAHHKWTNHPKNDPELAGRPRPDSWASLALYLTGWHYWTGMIRVLISNARGDFTADYLPARQQPAMRREARILLAIYALVLLSLVISPLAVWLWILPLFVGQPFLRLYLLAEHGLCPPVANMLENSRTTFTNRVVKFLAWNMPYHAEHHAFPNVPFHKLPAFHAVTRDHLRTTAPGYTAFAKDYAGTLKNE